MFRVTVDFSVIVSRKSRRSRCCFNSVQGTSFRGFECHEKFGLFRPSYLFGGDVIGQGQGLQSDGWPIVAFP